MTGRSNCFSYSNNQTFIIVRSNCDKLVYFENFIRIEEAIAREKQIKGGSRKGKEELINAFNPEWKDLWEVIKDW